MPIVFVHGVSNRFTQEYRDNQLARDAFLLEHVARRVGYRTKAILNPYWGANGVKFRWRQASLPEQFDSIETFGASLDSASARIAEDIVAPLGSTQLDIVAIARRSLADAIDMVWASAIPSLTTVERSTALAQSSRIAFDYAESHPQPSWLSKANNDNFVDMLLYDIDQEEQKSVLAATQKKKTEHFGSSDDFEELKEGLSRMLGFIPSAMSGLAMDLRRRKIHASASVFLGDIFEYLNTRGDRDHPGPIVSIVLEALRAACNQRTTEDSQVVVIGHSLGGVISYDVLTHFDPTLAIDVFVTVGSQVALFEEMGLYKRVLTVNAPKERVPRPANIKRWLNVMDANDAFSFRASGVYEGVDDFKYATGFGLMQAHSGYFHRPSFYRRLGERLEQVLP